MNPFRQMPRNRRLPPGLLIFLALPLLASLPVHAQTAWVEALEACGGPTPSAVVAAGNGKTALSLDRHGVIVSCIWPGPGGLDQFAPPESSDGNALPRGGARWGVRVRRDEPVLWQDDAGWKVDGPAFSEPGSMSLRGRHTHSKTGLVVLQTVYVHPGQSAFTVTIIVESGTVAEILWLQDGDPALDRAPEWPDHRLLQAGARDFAAHVRADGKHAVQFRPAGVTGQDREHLRHLAASPPVDAKWDVFPEGAACALSVTPDGQTVFSCVDARGNTGPAAFGDTRLLLSRVPSPDAAPQMLELHCVLANSPRLAAEALDSLFPEEGLPREMRMAVEPPPKSLTREQYQQLWPDIAMMRATAAPNSVGVFLPVSSPPLAVASPELQAWLDWAAALLNPENADPPGMPVFLKRLSTADTPNMPRWSLAPLLDTGGDAAAPEMVWSPAPTAWALMGTARRSRCLPGELRAKELAPLWDQAARAMDCLRRWTDPLTGAPRPGFDPQRMACAASVADILLAGAACDAALSIAEDLHIAPPAEWREWRRELDAQVRFHLVKTPAEPWPLSPSAALWLALTLPPKDPVLEAPVLVDGAQSRLGGVPALFSSRLTPGDPSKNNALWAAMRIVLALSSAAPPAAE